MKPTDRTTRRKPAFAPTILGCIDCRTDAERAADERAGLTWERVAADHLAGRTTKLEPKRATPRASRN